MRYAPEHKRTTRQRVLKAAGRRFRARGYEATSIDDVMADIGLTRGGFYGHFRSKAALFAEIVRSDHGLLRQLERRHGGEAATLAVETKRILDDYLAPAHRDAVAKGCTMAALSIDVGRGPKAARRAYGGALRRLTEELSRCFGDAAPADTRAYALAALAVGGFIMARACGDEATAAAMVRACRGEIARLLGAGR